AACFAVSAQCQRPPAARRAATHAKRVLRAEAGALLRTLSKRPARRRQATRGACRQALRPSWPRAWRSLAPQRSWQIERFKLFAIDFSGSISRRWLCHMLPYAATYIVGTTSSHSAIVDDIVRAVVMKRHRQQSLIFGYGVIKTLLKPYAASTS